MLRVFLSVQKRLYMAMQFLRILRQHRLLQRLPVTVYAKSLIKNILGTELPSTRVILPKRIMKHLQDLDQVIVTEEVFGWNEVNIYRKEWDLP